MGSEPRPRPCPRPPESQARWGAPDSQSPAWPPNGHGGRASRFLPPPAPTQGMRLRRGSGPGLALSAAATCDPPAPPPPPRRNVPRRLGCREPENPGPRPWQPRQHIYLLCSPISAPSGQVFALAGPREDVVFVSITGAGARRPRGHSRASAPQGPEREWLCPPRLGLPAVSLSSGIREMGIGEERRAEDDLRARNGAWAQVHCYHF